jgi:hypothetical protein
MKESKKELIQSPSLAQKPNESTDIVGSDLMTYKERSEFYLKELKGLKKKQQEG